jgi:hypothetical protein
LEKYTVLEKNFLFWGFEFLPAHCEVEEFRKCHSEICTFSILITLNLRHLKNGSCEETLFLNPPYCLQKSPPKGAQFPLRGFNQQWKINLYIGEQKSTPHPDKLLSLTTICSKAHLSFSVFTFLSSYLPLFLPPHLLP